MKGNTFPLKGNMKGVFKRFVKVGTYLTTVDE